jgi:hypothetical protein
MRVLQRPYAEPFEMVTYKVRFSALLDGRNTAL